MRTRPRVTLARGCATSGCEFWDELGERGEVRSRQHILSAQKDSRKHAPAHLFPLTGEERDGSVCEMITGERRAGVGCSCVSESRR